MKYKRRCAGISAILLLTITVLAASLLVMADEVNAADAVYESGVYNKLISLKEDYPDGMYWDHEVTSRGYNAFEHRDEQFADSVTAHPCSHSSYAAYDCNYFDRATQCWGFAARVFYRIFNKRISELPRSYGTDIAVGDYVRVDGDSHSGVALSIDGDTFTMAEGNIDGTGLIGWGPTTYNKGEISYYVHAPNYEAIDFAEPVNEIRCTTVFPVKAQTGTGIYLAGSAESSDSLSRVAVKLYRNDRSRTFRSYDSGQLSETESFDLAEANADLNLKTLPAGSYKLEIAMLSEGSDVASRTYTFKLYKPTDNEISLKKDVPESFETDTRVRFSGKAKSRCRIENVTAKIYRYEDGVPIEEYDSGDISEEKLRRFNFDEMSDALNIGKLPSDKYRLVIAMRNTEDDLTAAEMKIAEYVFEVIPNHRDFMSPEEYK